MKTFKLKHFNFVIDKYSVTQTVLIIVNKALGKTIVLCQLNNVNKAKVASAANIVRKAKVVC